MDIVDLWLEFEPTRPRAWLAYYEQLPDAQKSALQAVAMDMWEPYIGATREGLPNGDTKTCSTAFTSCER
jgi:transposase